VSWKYETLADINRKRYQLKHKCTFKRKPRTFAATDAAGKTFVTYRTDSTDSSTVKCFFLLNGWICLNGVLD